MTGGGSMQNWEPPTVEEAALLFPNYKVVDVLGRGGMGAVYKAVQTALERVVAIKLLPLEISIDRDFADRFVREARTMAKLNHPNIVSVYDFGTTTEGHLYFVMEFVEGTTLHQLIKSTGLKPSQALELIVSICEALQYAHSEGVVHRDIKPANVLVDTKGRVKVADFGLARVDAPTAEQWGQTMTGMVLGTPDYMAPEQKSGSRVDHRADIYSLGVMLYEMLCGQIPQGIFDPPSRRVSVDERIDQVVIRAMQQEPDRRYANTAEMKGDVENIRLTPLPKGEGAAAVLGGKKVAPGAGGAKALADREADTPAGPRREKSATPWLAGVAALCALVAVSVVIVQMMRPVPREVAPAVPPPAPELAPIKPAAPPVVDNPAESTEPKVAKNDTEPAKPETPSTPAEPGAEKTEPKTQPTLPLVGDAPIALVNSPAKNDSGGEPPAPVAPPPSEPPVAVATVPGSQRVPQIVPAPVGTTSLEQAPVPRAEPVNPQPGANPPAPDAPANEVDWHTLANSGDALMERRQNDDAMDAYTNAFDMATDGRPVSAAEITQLCRKLATYQIRFGSTADARRTLDQGRAALKRMSGGKDNADRQKLIEQIENSIRSLPRD
jgi:serine/threonine protein kinase